MSRILQNIFSDKNNKTLFAFLLLASLAINLYFRFDTLVLPSARGTAKEAVYGNIKTNLSQKAILPGNLTKEQQQNYLGLLEQTYIKENRKEINQAIAAKEKELKSYYQDENGWTYLLEIDPYRWQRRVDNFLKTGHFGTEQICGKEYDGLMFFPKGARIEPIKLHFYIGALLYKSLHIFNNKLSLMNCLSFHPIILSIILIISIFIISGLLGISYIGSFIASLFIGLASIILTRTSFGWFDTDIYNITMPIIIFSVIAYSFKKEKSLNHIFMAVSGLLIGIYSTLWSIWWLIFYLALASILLYKTEVIFYGAKRTLPVRLKQSCITIAIFISASYLSVLIFSGFDAIKKSFYEVLLYLSIKNNHALDNFWPNIAFSVDELGRATTESIKANMGGDLILYGGILGLLSLFFYRKHTARFKERRFLMFALFLWFSVAVLLSGFGKRFILFMVTPSGIALGFLWDFLQGRVKGIKIYKKSPKTDKHIKNILFILILVAVMAAPINNATQRSVKPMFNDTWQDMLIKIKYTTPENAVINAWWDYGDYIMTVGNRVTTMDASWQYSITPYWTARALISPDEKEAMGIFRMLDSGGNQAFEKILKISNDDKFKTIELLNKLILLDEKGGRMLLEKYADKNQIGPIIAKLYNPHPGYLLIDNRIMYSAGLLGLIGKWDFNKLTLWNHFNKLDEKEFLDYAEAKLGYSQSDSRQLYTTLLLINQSDVINWISSNNFVFYSAYAKKTVPPKQKKIFFSNGAMLDLDSPASYFMDTKNNRWVIPGITIIYDNDKNEINRLQNKEGDPLYTMFINREGSLYKAILVSTPLAESLYFKLYFMKGAGLKYFKLENNQYHKDGSNIFLYKVDWDTQKGEPR